MKTLEHLQSVLKVLKVILYTCIPILAILLLIVPFPIESRYLHSNTFINIKCAYILILIIAITVCIVSVLVIRYSILLLKYPKTMFKSMNIIENLKDEIKISTETYSKTDSSIYLNEISIDYKNIEAKYLAKDKYSLMILDIGEAFSSTFIYISKLASQDLTEDDYLFCALTLLKYPKITIEFITRWSYSAIKSRQHHLKKKIPDELYQLIFNQH